MIMIDLFIDSSLIRQILQVIANNVYDTRIWDLAQNVNTVEFVFWSVGLRSPEEQIQRSFPQG
jgi:hypothetical protein